VRTAAWTEIPNTCAGLYLNDIEIAQRVNETTWRVVARYKAWEWVESPDSTFSFDTSGGSQHITQSIATRGRYGPKATAQLGGAIGYDGQSVQGVDIVVPVFSFSETHIFNVAKITQSYKLRVFQKTGCVNSDAFRGFAPGEVLFQGATGNRQGDDPSDPWEINYRFSSSLNRVNLRVGDITGITKRGWDYLWVQYEDAEDADKKILVKKPCAVYVEQVYYETDFATLFPE
jgi:hypothetical protein